MAKSRNELFWGKYAESYDRTIDSAIGEESRRQVFGEIERQRSLGEAVEFGCGPGYFTRAIARNAQHVLATDLSDCMLNQARSNLRSLRNVDFTRADCEGTTFKDASFDTVLMANVLLILEHPEKAIAEAHRVLKPGGRLIMSNYTNHGIGIFDKFVFFIRIFGRIGMPPFRQMLSPDEIRSLVENAGFRVEELKIVGSRVHAIFVVARAEN